MSIKHPIKPEWNTYYNLLEKIRCSGVCNMWGAAPVLAKMASIDEELASDILISWIQNYDELNKKYGWR